MGLLMSHKAISSIMMVFYFGSRTTTWRDRFQAAEKNSNVLFVSAASRLPGFCERLQKNILCVQVHRSVDYF